MDSLTQATLGAACGELVLGKRLGNWAVLWGALVGTLPDLDIIASPFLDHAGDLWWHRGPSHSILVTVIVSIALGATLSKLWKKKKISPALAIGFVFLVWSTHVLIDCFTSYGTSVLWPFAPDRIAFNNMAIIDPLFTLPMLVAVIWVLFLRNKSNLQKRRKINAWGLGIAATYTLLSFGLKWAASNSFERDLATRNVHYDRRMESPTLFNILLWRSVVDRGDEYWVGYHSVLESPSKPVHWTIYPKQKEALRGLEEMRETKTVQWFSDGWWIARPHVKGAWIADLRFGERRSWQPNEQVCDHRMVFAWDILPQENDHLRPKFPRGGGDNSEMLKQMGHRILGNQDKWDQTPRLEGVTGSLPEILVSQP